MSVNSSSFADLPPPPNFFSNSSDFNICSNTKSFIYIFSAFSLNIIFLMPLLIFVLYLGYQKSRKPRSSSTATSHSDHFTYHSIFMLLIEYNGTAFYFIGMNINSLKMVDVGVALLSVVSCGQALFHLLTCVERYLAVVHPVTYLGLRQGGGVRIRNISIGFLYVLKRSGPGEGGGNKEHTDQSKQRAFYAIMGILGSWSPLFSAVGFEEGKEGRSEETLLRWASMYINMSDNSSSFANYPLLPPLLPSSNTTYPILLDQCFKFKTITYIYTALYIIYILLPLPFFILVLHLGYQKSRKQRSSSTATSHSDHLTYHSIFLQLNECLGLAFLFIGGYTNLLEMLLGTTLLNVISVGQALFHLLTCVERYLVVVHPITYLGLRQRGGRPGPGEGGWTRERVDQSKQRAFYAIMAIMGVLMLRAGK
ncbi:hypothetical protein NQZ68_041620 [Dissostichus eleginoides]|nr:hypothetical protein NQZ68_041620 [Dissostichus eleginoides]